MIEVKNLQKHFNDLQVLNGITEQIRDGEVVVVIGPSGSGKSTFLRCLTLLEEPTAGQVIIDGQQMSNAIQPYMSAGMAGRVLMATK